jgi:LEA14-like dessication related protein
MRKVMAMVLVLILAACATMGEWEPLQVTVADIESIPSESLEWRMLVKLRVQNPNETPVDFDGVYVRLDVLDKTLASGVSDQRGSIPRYGEALVAVPVTVSAVRVALGVLGVLGGAPIEKIPYRMEGKLDSPGFGSTRFTAQGELAVPKSQVPGAAVPGLLVPGVPVPGVPGSLVPIPQ